MTIQAAPGVVLAVKTGTGLTGDLIRIGEVLEGKEGVANHVILVTHQDAKGRWIGIQGQPGGVGLVDCTLFLADSWTRGNYGQVMALAAGANFASQLATYLASCAKSMGVRYDWVGIAEDGLGSLHLNDLTAKINAIYSWDAPHGQMPGDFVCSSLAWWQYDNVGWAHPDPGAGETCEPADWWTWSDQQQWTASPPWTANRPGGSGPAPG